MKAEVEVCVKEEINKKLRGKAWEYLTSDKEESGASRVMGSE
jgi:hypothetical protein